MWVQAFIEGRGEHPIPWSWSYKQVLAASCGFYEPNFQRSAIAGVALNCQVMSPLPQMFSKYSFCLTMEKSINTKLENLWICKP